VFKATDLAAGRTVAVKIPQSYTAGSQYMREAQIGASLDHPCLLKFIPVPEAAKSRPYHVTEFLDGRSLYDELRARGGTLPVDDALRLAARMCDGLDYLHHHHVVHADLKPANVMLCADGSLRIIDFGIARWAKGRPKSLGGYPQHLGTPEYMAPEIVKGKRGDARTDLYVLGAMLYEMITGRRPYEDQHEDKQLVARLVGDPLPPSHYVPDLPPQVDEIVLHALARKPADRYQSAAEMRADLAAPEKVAVTGRADRLQKPVLAKLWWPVAGLVGGCLAGLVGAFFVLLWLVKK